MTRDRGLSLIEILVVISLIALVATMGLPAMTRAASDWNTRQTTGELAAALRLTRSEALARNTRVTLCQSMDGMICNWERTGGGHSTEGWERGWMLFVDNGSPDREILHTALYSDPRVHITGNAPVREYVSFTGLGAARRRHGALQMGTLSICAGTTGQAIVLSRSGRIRSQPIRCSGWTMLETLFLLVIFSISALGILEMKNHLLRSGQLAAQHALADLMAMDLRERSWASHRPMSQWLEAWQIERNCATATDHFCLPDLQAGLVHEASRAWIEISWHSADSGRREAERITLRWPADPRSAP